MNKRTIPVLLLFGLVFWGCDDGNDKSNKYHVRVTVYRSLYETNYSLGNWINGDEVVSKTECGSDHPTLPDEEPDCFTLGFGEAFFFEYETTLMDGDRISVFANTVHHSGECGDLDASIYVNDNKVIWDEDDEDDCYSLSVGCSWTVNE